MPDDLPEKIRAFIAIELPESILQTIQEAQDTLKGYGFGIRWVRRQGMHLTLKFLGNIRRGDLEQLRGAIEQASLEFLPFSLKGKGIGVFPDIRRPRVVWVGVLGDVEALCAFQRRLESQLKVLGFPKERRPFKGHLTLGRVKDRVDRTKLGEALEELKGFQTEPFTAGSVVLFESDLRPSGAIYSKLAEAPFRSA